MLYQLSYTPLVIFIKIPFAILNYDIAKTNFENNQNIFIAINDLNSKLEIQKNILKSLELRITDIEK